KKLANGDPPLRLSFEHTHACGAKGGVLLVRGLHQSVEYLVVKYCPPRTDIGRLALDCRFVRLDPVGGSGSGRANIVRSNHRTTGRRKHYKRSESSPEYVVRSRPIAHGPTIHSSSVLPTNHTVTNNAVLASSRSGSPAYS